MLHVSAVHDALQVMLNKRNDSFLCKLQKMGTYDRKNVFCVTHL